MPNGQDEQANLAIGNALIRDHQQARRIPWRPIDDTAKDGRKVLVWFKSPFSFGGSFAATASFMRSKRPDVFGQTSWWEVWDGRDNDTTLDPRHVTHYADLCEP